MINIVHVDIHLDDERNITAVEMKLKSLEDNKPELSGHPLIATVSAAFYKTTLLTDFGKSLTTELNPNRSNIINLTVSLKENTMTYEDVGKFVDYFQKALDETKLF